MKLLVGLGNPGPEYADTRHNVGVRVLERFAAEQGIAFGAERFHGRFGCGRLRGEVGATASGGAREAGEAREEVALLAPLTFMNRSGSAVAAALAELPVADPSADLWLVFDDVDLPFGRLRLRPGGGAGGHRGLADVIRCAGRSDLPRLRFGVGRPAGGGDTAEYVLAPFSGEESQALPGLLARAAEALAHGLRVGVTPAMNRFNRDPAAEPAAEPGTELGKEPGEAPEGENSG